MHADDTLALARRFIALPAEKRKVFWKSLQEGGIDFSLFPIPAGQGTGEPSYAQQRMWLLWKLDPDTSAYHIALSVRLRGALGEAALEGALADLLRRQQALRTVFRQTDEGLRAVVVDGAQPDLVRYDLSGLSAVAAEARLRDLGDAALRAPFDLEAGLPLRATLFRLGAEEHVLLLVMHHIASDGWSLGVLVEEVARLYDARRRGGAAALPELPVQYADYAVWQRRWLEAGEGERQLAYWRRQLGGAAGTLDLPLDRPRPAVWSYRGAALDFALPHGLSEGLAALAQRHQATMFMLLAAAFKTLLYRHSGQGDISVGVPVANRHRVETERLVGFFVNTQVLRSRLDGRQSFLDGLRQVRDTALEAQSHQDLPFEQLVEALQPERTLSHNPLFQVMFNHAQSEGDGAPRRLGGLEIEALPQPQTTTQFDLQLNSRQDRAGRLSASLVYATDLFDAATIERLRDHFLTLLVGILDRPDAALDDLPLLAAEERRTLLQGWNDTRTRFDDGAGLLERIERTAAARPYLIALIAGNERLSYRELNARANRLAHRLRGWGVGPDRLVGIAAERSVEMVVGLLGILKAGGAYVPFDADLPAGRLAGMLEQSGVELLLTQQRLLPRLPETSARLWCLDLDWEELDGFDEENPVCGLHPDNLAYCIFTSGSTGRPKPVGNSHAGLLNRLQWMQQAYGLTAGDVVLQKTPFSFDVSVWEFFWPLMQGATLVMAAPGAHRDPRLLREVIVAHGVTTLHFVPSMLQAFIDAGELPACSSLRRVLCSGEALPEELQRRFQARHPAPLHNLYGPTEAAIDVTAWTCGAGAERRGVPIGRPIANTRILILDAGLNPVPVGVAGELHIGGVNLARGYLGQPGLTADRFIPDPFGKAGERLYRTGDLARWRADGVIDYIGRRDHQVKIRGRRIELGEIEAVLAEHPEVRQAAVILRETAGTRQLVACVAADPDADLPERLPDQLKDHLRAVLPDYMVPGQILVLDQLPLSPNGKLDRKALPDLPAPARGHVAPATAEERILADLWSELLGVAEVGATDNFFELGGDSIVAIQLVGRARRSGLRLSPRDLFQHQTVQALARVAVPEEAPSADRPAPEGEAVLLPIQRWFFEQPMSNRAHWNQAVLLRARAPVDRPALAAALAALVGRHDALRLRFRRGPAGDWRQVYAPAEAAALLWEREAADAADFDRHVADAHVSLDLAEGPLLRALLLRLAEGGERLLLVIHHLVVDGVSWRVLLEDLAESYRQAAVGEAPRLPPRAASYQDWAARLPAEAQARLDELPWWEAQLGTGAAPLPADRPDGASLAGDAGQISITLDRERTRALLQEASQAYRTRPEELLLAALARLLCRWSGGEAVLVQMEGHGREEGIAPDLDLGRTVGWFTSLYPVRLAPGAPDDPGGTLRAVKEQLRAVPGRGVGYGLLRHLAGPEAAARLAALPAAQLTFNYLGRFDRDFPADAAFLPATESSGQGQAADAPMPSPLTLDGLVHDGTLRLVWGYSRARYREETVAELAALYRAELSALIDHCLDPAAGGVTPSDFPLAGLDQAALDGLPVTPRRIEDIHPLSPLQQGILFHSLAEPDGTAYLNQVAVTLEGLDTARFVAAWQAVAERHGALRSAVSWRDGAPVPLQIVHRQATLAPEFKDWRGRPDAAAELDDLARTERRKGFDLSAAPLMRLVLVRLDGDRHRVLWTYHHILFDGWSAGQLLGEVLQHYAGEALPPVPPSFHDYVAWLMARDGEADRRFWLDRLAGLDGPILLAEELADAVAEPAEGERHGVVAGGLDALATQRLQVFARQQKVTLNTLVQAAWLVLLHRCTGQDTVLCGATTAGRPAELPDIERRIGLFINSLPLAATPDPARPVADWLQEVQAINLGMREHEHTPLGDIQRWLGAAGQALFDTLLVFENYPVAEAFRRHALRVVDAASHERPNYPLMLEVAAGETLRLHYHHDRSRFGDVAVRRIDRFLCRLLLAMAEDPRRSLGNLPLFDAAERAEILAQGLESSPPSTLRFPQAFERQAALTPAAVAVIQGGRTVTYAELDRRASRLARRLRSAGVGPDRLVAVAMERTPALPAALLAVLKAGGAYVPLDPAFPPDRLGYMLENSGAALLLTESHLLAELFRPDGLEVWCLDGDESDEGDGGEAAAGEEPTPDHLAYVIYTSGSTGRPKGVAVRRGALGNFLESMGREPGIGRDDRVLALTSLSFDIAALELFLPLSVGGAVVLVDRDTARDPARLWAEIGRHGVTAVQATPSTWRMLGEAGDFSALAGAKILCGGEALPAELAARLCAAGPVWNLYGPTETTVWSAVARLDRERPQPRLGGPVARTALHLLDHALEPVPAGVTGELYIGGDGLARGYHGRPDLTAERFVPDPFAGGGGRLYRTGDLARRRGDGTLDYVGRADHQVKIRGFRIELGEIEARLCGHPLVRAAAVVAREGAGGTRLVGYVAAPEEGADGLEAALKALLQGQLPDYMVPARILRLDALPLTPNRKLDRKALPDPEWGPRDPVPPRSETERRLAAIWAELLGVERIGVTDGFFELGGHSLLLTRLVARVRADFGIELPLVALLEEALTVESLAARIDRQDPAEGGAELELMSGLLDELEHL